MTVQSFPGLTYVERIVPVPPRDASAALDITLLETEGASSAERATWRLDVDRGRVVLAAPADPTDPVHLSGVVPLRRTAGSIRAGAYRFHVELEILAWSETASVVGIRPVGSRPRRLGTQRYHRAASAALDHIRTELLRWAHASATAGKAARTR